MRKIVAIIVCLILLVSCSSTELSEDVLYALNSDNEVNAMFEKTTQEKLAQAEINKTTYQDDYNYSKNLLITQEERQMAASRADVNSVAKKTSYKEFITIDEAVDDINLYFRILKYTYSAYKYWGGDEYFNAMKEEMINKISSIAQNGKISSKTFKQTISNIWRSNIYDTHFYINGNKCYMDSKRPHTYYINLEMDKDSDNYYFYEDGEKLTLVSCDNDKCSIKEMLNPKGELKYSYFWITNSDEINNCPLLNLTFSNEQGKIVSKVYKFSVRSDKPNYVQPQIKTAGGVSYIAFPYIENYEERVAKSYELARKARKDYLTILDLRNNGGDPSPVFTLALLGKKPELYAFNTLTVTALEPRDKCKEVTYGNEKSWFEDSSHGYNHGTRVLSNDHKLIVLTDQTTGCGGESFLLEFMGFENVIVIGSSTSGVGFCSGYPNFLYLPNSGLEFSCGVWLLLHGRNNIEDTAICPNVMVNGKTDILDSTLNWLLNNGYINQEQFNTLKN